MDNLYLKSCATLELGRVLEMLSAHAVSNKAKKNALELVPDTDCDAVNYSQQQTSDAKKLIGLRGAPPFSGIRDVSDSLRRADAGGSLNLKELLDIASLLRTARMVRGYLSEEREISTCLDGLFNSLSANKHLEESITRAIVSEEEVADGASPALADVRRKMRGANGKIRDVLQKIVSSPTQSKYLQENIITQRSGRYVVPVKSEHKGDIGGLVHDVSSSGATLFIEPMQVVSLNNELRELEAKEKKEIDRILAELSAEVSSFSDTISRDFELLCTLDLIFAKAKLSYQLNADEPEINDKGQTLLKNARHPLLDAEKTVPISVQLGIGFDTLIITGPNTGGKTVALKTVGLMTLMAECGLHIPVASGSRISTFERIYADIGDEQSIEQSLSTFSSHMKNIVGMLEGVDSRTLILFDELGAGTDPVEGAALAVSIIEYARKMGARVVATTHYTELKSYALTTERVENASCEFDVETLKPTYKLLIGVPGKSNAFAIASRLGLSDYIIERARSLVDSEDQRFDEVLARLEEKRNALETELSQAEKQRREAELLTRRAREFDDEIEKRREAEFKKAKADAERMLRDARAAADEIFDEIDALRKAQRKKDNYQQINDARAALKHSLNDADRALNRAGGERAKNLIAPAPARPLKVGDTVELIELGTKATVLSVPDKSGMVQVQAGILKVNVNQNKLKLLEESGKKTVEAFIAKKQAELRNIKISQDIDVRGMMSDEAVDTVERYLDNAFMAKLNTVTVIHGKGTGALRKAIQTRLRSHPHVKSFRLGTFGEGESGVTVIELK